MIDQCLKPINHDFDIIGFRETKLTSDLEHLYSIPDYNAFYNNRGRLSGGLAININSKYLTYTRPDLTMSYDFLETLFIEVKTNSSTFMVGQIYRRPHTDMKSFMEKLKFILEKITLENKICILLGDYNIDLLKSNNSTEELTSIFNSKFYYNSITKPTRVKGRAATLIDHVWTNRLENILTSGIVYM